MGGSKIGGIVSLVSGTLAIISFASGTLMVILIILLVVLSTFLFYGKEIKNFLEEKTTRYSNAEAVELMVIVKYLEKKGKKINLENIMRETDIKAKKVKKFLKDRTSGKIT